MSSPRSLSKLLAGHVPYFSRWRKPAFLMYFKPVFGMADHLNQEEVMLTVTLTRQLRKWAGCSEMGGRHLGWGLQPDAWPRC